MHDNGKNEPYPDSKAISKLFLAYNATRYENLLQRYPVNSQKDIRTLPLLFHVNQNLLPGHINRHVPHTIYDYVPDADSIAHANTFNSAFSYIHEDEPAPHSIDAVYLQDNLKSGMLILWIIHNRNLEPEEIELLKQKAARVENWREAKKLNLRCHVTLPGNMPAIYWGEKYDSLHPDKSIFLDDFYSESILLAGKQPAWWHVAPDQEARYEQYIEDIKTSYPDAFSRLINFGAITNARPQDYLAAVILNLAHAKNCPQETWLNIMDLCHKLSIHPATGCIASRIKNRLCTLPTQHPQYQDIYCNSMNEIMASIYGREQTIIIDRTLKLIAHNHDKNRKSANIYTILLANRNTHDIETNNTLKQDLEFVTATEILADLIRQASLWFINKLQLIDDCILLPGSNLATITANLMQRMEPRPHHIAITNIHPVKAGTPYDVCIRHNIENRNNSWSLTIIDDENNSFDIKHGKGPVELAAWATLNRIITHTTRISVSCPYMSVKQTYIAGITSILLGYLNNMTNIYGSLDTYLTRPIPINDILIINEEQANTALAPKTIQIYRFQVTSHGEVKFSKYNNLDGFLALVCDALTTDIQAGNKAHSFFLHRIGGGICNSFILEAREIYNKICQFVYGPRKGYTHFIDVTNDRYYAISRTDNVLTAHPDINPACQEDYIDDIHNIMTLYSSDVENNAVLNYLYRNNVHDCLQLFFEIHDDIAHVYILDENGILTNFSQPFHDRQGFINQWLMFLFNTRNHIKSSSCQAAELPNIDIYELSYNKYNQLLKNRLNSSMLPIDDHYFDLTIRITGEPGNQAILFKCEDREFSSAEYGTEIYSALRKYLARNFRIGANNPIYVSDVDIPLSQFNLNDQKSLHIRDYVKQKINIEKRLNAILNKR